jgi:hypothetical protein
MMSKKLQAIELSESKKNDKMLFQLIKDFGMNSVVKLIVLCLLVLVSSVCFAADINYTDSGTEDHLWSNTANWNGGVFPNDSASGAACNAEGTLLQITNGIDAVCKGFVLGMYGKTNSAEISRRKAT